MNTRIKWKMYLVLVIVVVGALGILVGRATVDRSAEDEPLARSIVQEDGSPQEYTCSMHPQIRSLDPNDKCPICGMDLIPVPRDDEDADDGDLPRLRLTPRAMAMMQVQVQPVTRREVHVPVRLFGRLEPDETRLRTIAAWVPGRLDELHVNYTGTVVAPGQPLARIYSPSLIAAQEELLQAIRTARELEASTVGRTRDVAQLTVDAARDRLRLFGLDDAQIQDIESGGRPRDHLTIPAPNGGVVVERLASTGDYVETGQPIYRLADLSVLWAQLEAYESDLRWLSMDQKVTILTRSYPGETFDGVVTFIDPVLSDRTRTVRVRVEVDNASGRLKPNMFVNAVVQSEAVAPAQGEHAHEHAATDMDSKAHTAPLVIPASAPLITGTRAIVYVQLRDTDRPTFEPREITLGPRAGAWYLVDHGLAEGDLVVTHGSFKIDSELQIRGRRSMMQPEGGKPPTHDHGEMGGAAPPASGKPQTIEVPNAFKVDIGTLVRLNFGLVDALAGDDSERARQAGLDLMTALHEIDASALSPSAQRQWVRLTPVIHSALDLLAESPELDKQREHFESFSSALTDAVRVFGLDGVAPVYQAVCPMVKGRKGYWLQEHTTVMNPYWGARMLRCGEIAEMIVEPEPGATQ